MDYKAIMRSQSQIGVAAAQARRVAAQLSTSDRR
jgi:hypothetical protein